MTQEERGDIIAQKTETGPKKSRRQMLRERPSIQRQQGVRPIRGPKQNHAAARAKEKIDHMNAQAALAHERDNKVQTLVSEKEMDVETTNLTHHERFVVEEHERLSPHLIFEIIRRDGLEEMQRPIKALVYSGVAAGIMISFSFFCYAVLGAELPDSIWEPIIAKWGYTIGFIIVILGRMQLFTENTITTVVPIFKPFQWVKVWITIKLWTIVFISNLIGTAIAAAYLSHSAAIDPHYTTELIKITKHVQSFSPWQNFVRGIPAGILIAAVVWMMPSAREFSIFLIGIVTYFISLGDFTHVVVGSCEMAYAFFNGHATLWDYFGRFLIPTSLGNILGGTGIFTILVYGQIKEELPLKEFRSRSNAYLHKHDT